MEPAQKQKLNLFTAREGLYAAFVAREKQMTRDNPIFEQVEYCNRLRSIQIAAKTLLYTFKSLPGGDGYRFEGTSNNVEDLENALASLEDYTRHTWFSIYERELQKLLAQCMPEDEAIHLAQDNADEIYYELVGRGRNEAKDGEGRYSHQMQDKGGDTE